MTTLAPPGRSYEQKISALELANETRSYRAALKRRLKSGRVSVGTVLLGMDPRLGTMKVQALLMAVPKIGPVKARKILKLAGVSASRTVGGLSRDQRGELLRVLGERG